ncbi:hypothetical protein KC323_g204 [Hortaea werneckii]|nr:hypothetical protein KC323_g204 [Hortaea werneckii]
MPLAGRDMHHIADLQLPWRLAFRAHEPRAHRHREDLSALVVVPGFRRKGGQLTNWIHMDRSREGLRRLLGSRVGLVGGANELHGCVVSGVLEQVILVAFMTYQPKPGPYALLSFSAAHASNPVNVVPDGRNRHLIVLHSETQLYSSRLDMKEIEKESIILMIDLDCKKRRNACRNACLARQILEQVAGADWKSQPTHDHLSPAVTLRKQKVLNVGFVAVKVAFSSFALFLGFPPNLILPLPCAFALSLACTCSHPRLCNRRQLLTSHHHHLERASRPIKVLLRYLLQHLLRQLDVAVFEVVIVVPAFAEPRVSHQPHDHIMTDAIDLPRRVVYRIDELIKLISLRIAKQTRLLVAAGVINVHGRHAVGPPLQQCVCLTNRGIGSGWAV